MTVTIDPAELSAACDRLDTRISDGTLTRGEWVGRDEHGRDTACLIAAMHPPCGERESASACPATIMPRWLAQLTLWINDAPSEAAWPVIIRRYASLARRWWALTLDDWVQLDYEARAIIVREARSCVAAEEFPEVIAAIDGVLAMLDRAAGGDMPTDAEFEASAAAAWSASEAEAAWAARAATWAAREAAAAWAASAWAEACDRMIGAILDAIERRIAEREESHA